MPPLSNPSVPADVKAMQALVARLEARIAALEQIVSLQGDGSVNIQSPGKLKISATKGVEISSSSATLTIQYSGCEINGSLFKLTAGNVSIAAPIVKSTGIVMADVMQCNTVIAATYTPGAGNIW